MYPARSMVENSVWTQFPSAITARTDLLGLSHTSFRIRMNRAIYRNALCMTAATLAATAVPAQAEVYLTESQALGVILGDKAVVGREQKVLDIELRRKLEQASNLRFPESSFTFFIAMQDAKPAKYAIVMNEIGKTEPITFMVGMSPEGKITEVVIMEFRENRGWEVKEKRF